MEFYSVEDPQYMISRRKRAVFDLLLNVVGIFWPLFLKREKARIERLQREGTLEDVQIDEDGSIESGEMDHISVRTMFGLGAAKVEMPNVRSTWVLVGLISGILNRVLYDHDITGVRRSWTRRGMLIAGNSAIELLIGFKDRDLSNSFALGSSIGAVCYRIKYGLLDEVPGD